jgi:NAD+ synthase
MKNPQNTYNHLVSQLKKYFAEAGYKKAVLGLSGGVDSALTLKIAIDALGENNVIALLMPEYGVTKDENTIHAKRLSQFLHIRQFMVPINKYLMDLLQLPWKPSELAQINTKARARSIILYNYANTERALVLGTSNKSELLLGYGTKYGDLAADVLPLADVYKTDVVALAENVGLPDEITHKPPTAELYKDQTDEQELGAPYQHIDPLLKKLVEASDDQITEETIDTLYEKAADLAEEITTLTRPIIEGLLERVKKNRHKSQLPYIISAS